MATNHDRTQSRQPIGPESASDDTSLALIEEQADRSIRRIWHDDRWFFSVIDVVGVLTDSPNPSNYWMVMKARIRDEGFVELAAKCLRLKLKATDGKQRLTDCADIETLKCILRYVPATAAWRVRREHRPECMVYVIGPQDGSMVKIGVSTDVAKRLRTHQSGSPVLLAVLWQMPGGYELERRLHQTFADRRAYGEWFDFHDADVVAAVQAATAQIAGAAV